LKKGVARKRGGIFSKIKDTVMLNYRTHLKPYARTLRQAIADSENALWARLRRKQIHGVQFYRQRPIGNYIVDFYAPAARLVIEVDGSQHLEVSGRARDTRRDAALESQGLLVLRFDSSQVLRETDAVVEQIGFIVAERLKERGK